MPAFTRRLLIAALLAGAPAAAFARSRPAPRIRVDVSPLRRKGDRINADYLAQFLPIFLAGQFGPGHDVRVRIDDVTYGAPGSNGQVDGNGAVDSIEGVGWVDGREIPLFSALQTQISLPDVGNYQAHLRQEMLAKSFAQWLARKAGG
jgi:hypothetical protein